MKNSFVGKATLIGVSSALLTGCVVHHAVYTTAPGPAVVEVAPAPPAVPAQPEVMMVAPGSLDVYYWAPGMWEWTEGRYVWVEGHWLRRPHPGAIWSPPHWEVRRNRQVWVKGSWR